MGDVYGWIGLVLGQGVAWPQVLKLRREPGSGVSLLTYALLLVSMSLYLAHAVEIHDTVTIVSVPVAFVPNVLIAFTLVRRRIAGAAARTPDVTLEPSGGDPACGVDEAVARQRARCEARFGRSAEWCCDASIEQDGTGRLLSRPPMPPA
ncbi:MAG: hypothetical protein HY240_07880 [Actinobacteria bacterium]|nr:hypothetical protein [Actinomycetota bacterium]